MTITQSDRTLRKCPTFHIALITQTHVCVHAYARTHLKTKETFAHYFTVQLIASNILTLKICDLELSASPPSSNSMQQATLELLHFLFFISTPRHPPSLTRSLTPRLPACLPPSALLFTPSTGKSSSWFFSLKRAEANWILAALQFPGLWLQAGGGGRTREGRQERKWRAKKEKEEKKKAGKSAVWGIFKAHTDNSRMG